MILFQQSQRLIPQYKQHGSCRSRDQQCSTMNCVKTDEAPNVQKCNWNGKSYIWFNGMNGMV